MMMMRSSTPLTLTYSLPIALLIRACLISVRLKLEKFELKQPLILKPNFDFDLGDDAYVSLEPTSAHVLGKVDPHTKRLS